MKNQNREVSVTAMGLDVHYKFSTCHRQIVISGLRQVEVSGLAGRIKSDE